MKNKTKFETFLESLKGKGDDALIESIKAGFQACFETILPQEAKHYTDEYEEDYTSDYAEYLGGAETDVDEEPESEEYVHDYHNYDDKPDNDDKADNDDIHKNVDPTHREMKIRDDDFYYWRDDNKGMDRSWKKHRQNQHKD